MFIELTEENEGKIFLNINSIESVGFLEGITDIETNKGTRYYVKESYTQVKQLIKNQVAAERGY